MSLIIHSYEQTHQWLKKEPLNIKIITMCCATDKPNMHPLEFYLNVAIVDYGDI